MLVTKKRKLERRHMTGERRFSIERPFRPPPFIDLPEGMTLGEVHQFFREQRIEELGKKVRANVLEMPHADVQEVKLTEALVRREMEEEYSRLIRSLLKSLPGYVPPADWVPQKAWKKVWLPVDEYPHINFLALILGPRGATHVKIQEQSKCRIELRGRDVMSQTQSAHEARLPLHVFIEGDDEDDVDNAISLLSQYIDPTFEGFSFSQASALTQLASLNPISPSYIVWNFQPKIFAHNGGEPRCWPGTLSRQDNRRLGWSLWYGMYWRLLMACYKGST